MSDFCLVCGANHPGAVRGGILTIVPKACRIAKAKRDDYRRTAGPWARARATVLPDRVRVIVTDARDRTVD
jgi:hypothetical protein